MAQKIILQRYNIMMIFIRTVHSVSLILIYTVTLIALKSYSNAFWYTTFMVCPPGGKM
jgi:hypothetical protein